MGQAIVNPTTFAVGDDITATILNQYRSAVIALASREGAKATVNTNQTISAGGTGVTMNNGGTNAWSATEDTGSFVSATGGTTTPISIPTGKSGLYTVSARLIYTTAPAGRNSVQILVNGTAISRSTFPDDSETIGTLPFPLNVGDTLGLKAYSLAGATATSGSYIACYRQSS